MPKKRSSMGKGVKKNIKERKSGRKYLELPDGVELFVPEGGKKYKFYILPYILSNIKNHTDKSCIPDDIWWKLPFGLHRNIGPDNESAICPGTNGKTCIVCTEKQGIYDDPDGDNDEAKKLNASKRTLFVIKMKSGDKNGKIMVMDISDYCFLDQLMREIETGEPEWENFADLEDGLTLKVRFIVKKIGAGKASVEFPMADRIDFLARDDYDESILDESPCLDDILQVPTSKQIENIFYGVDDDDDEDDEKPVKKDKKEKKEKKEKKAKVSKKEEPKEEPTELSCDDLQDMEEAEMLEIVEAEGLEIDEDDYDDEDELRGLILDALDLTPPKKEGKSKKKAKKPKKEKKEVEPDPEDDDDDDEDDEPPKKKDKKKGKVKGSKKGKDKPASTKNALQCPYAYQFGTEFEDHDECDEDECKMYEKCMDAFENE